MNKKDLKEAKKSGRKVIFKNGSGFSYEGKIEVLNITGTFRCWFLGESEKGMIICLPLAKLTLEEKQKIEYERQSAIKMRKAVASMTESQKEAMVKILQRAKRDYLLSEKFLTEKASLKNFSLSQGP